MQMNPNRDTQLCMSLSARPGNFGLRFHNHLYEQLGLNFYYKAFSSQDLPGAVVVFAPWVSVAAACRCRSRKPASHWWMNSTPRRRPFNRSTPSSTPTVI